MQSVVYIEREGESEKKRMKKVKEEKTMLRETKNSDENVNRVSETFATKSFSLRNALRALGKENGKSCVYICIY